MYTRERFLVESLYHVSDPVYNLLLFIELPDVSMSNSHWVILRYPLRYLNDYECDIHKWYHALDRIWSDLYSLIGDASCRDHPARRPGRTGRTESRLLHQKEKTLNKILSGSLQFNFITLPPLIDQAASFQPLFEEEEYSPFGRTLLAKSAMCLSLSLVVTGERNSREC